MCFAASRQAKMLTGAHAIDREARILTALGKTGFPVAHIHGLCADDSVIGTWFYVMEMVEGRIFWDATFPGVDRNQRPAYFDAMNAAIARLRGIDYDALGLGDYGKPGNYFARQIGRWSKQYHEDSDAGRDTAMDALVEWLPANIPAGDESSIVHGDFRSDNMIFHPTEPLVIAVLDRELSTLGHPLADFAYHAMMYQLPPHIVAGLDGADLAALNIPSEADYVAAYCRRTGSDGIANWDFYRLQLFPPCRDLPRHQGPRHSWHCGIGTCPRSRQKLSDAGEFRRRGNAQVPWT